jgi:hypothetical protein
MDIAGRIVKDIAVQNGNISILTSGGLNQALTWCVCRAIILYNIK